MFKSLFRPRKPVLDPTLGDPLAKLILKDAQHGKLTTLIQHEDRLREGEWDRRFFYVDLIGKSIADPSCIETLPDTPLGHLVRGCAAINLAWKARGRGQAETVSEEGAMMFFKYLEYALHHLVHAAEQDSKDPTGLAFLQTVALGLQMERSNAREWFDEAVRRDPLHQQAHYGYLYNTLEKWGGSHAEMYAFARETMGRVPETSTLYSILFWAHQERLLYFIAFDKDFEGGGKFITDKQVHEESLNVYRNSLGKMPKIKRVSDYWPHNVAVWWFMTLEIPGIVREETKKIGPYFTQHPWSVFYRDDPAAGYQKALEL